MSKKEKTKAIIITSKYDSICNKCKKSIYPGQIIRWNPEKRSTQHVVCHPKRRQEKIDPKKVKKLYKNKKEIEIRQSSFEKEEKIKEKEDIEKKRLSKYEIMAQGFLSIKESIKFLEIDEKLFDSHRTRQDFPKPIIINKNIFYVNKELKIYKEKLQRILKNEQF